MATDPTPTTRPAIQWRLVVWALIGIYAIAFLLLNNDKTSINFVFFTVETRLIWLILLSMALGALLMVLGPHLWRRARRKGQAPRDPEPPVS